MRELTLSAAEFSILTSLVEERVGLAYSLADRPIFTSKLSARALEAGFESALDYYYYLRYDDPNGCELEALVQALVVHETHFFRELQPIRVAVTRFLAPRISTGQKVRIWCAACSTGEEPLSLAMLLASMNLLQHVEIVASDISEVALARARIGHHGPRSLRQSLPDWARPYLTETEQGYDVDSTLIDALDFRKINLVDEQSLSALGQFDLVLCRNVLIYFRDQTSARVVQNLTNRLNEDGILLVGVSESLLRFDIPVACEEHGGVFFYRKAATR